MEGLKSSSLISPADLDRTKKLLDKFIKEDGAQLQANLISIQFFQINDILYWQGIHGLSVLVRGFLILPIRSMKSFKSIKKMLLESAKQNPNTSYIWDIWSENYLRDRRPVVITHNPFLVFPLDKNPAKRTQLIK